VSYERGLARAVLTDDGDLLTRFDGERNAAQGFKSSGVGKAEVFDFYFHNDAPVGADGHPPLQ
jgi:hypothetical protein